MCLIYRFPPDVTKAEPTVYFYYFTSAIIFLPACWTIADENSEPNSWAFTY